MSDIGTPRFSLTELPDGKTQVRMNLVLSNEAAGDIGRIVFNSPPGRQSMDDIMAAFAPCRGET